MKDAGGFGSPANPDCLEPVERFAAEATARHFAGSTAQVAFKNPASGSAFKADGKFGIVPKIEVRQNLRPCRRTLGLTSQPVALSMSMDGMSLKLSFMNANCMPNDKPLPTQMLLTSVDPPRLLLMSFSR